VAVDCVTPLETLRSIRYTLRSVEFEDVVLVTDSEKAMLSPEFGRQQLEFGFRCLSVQQGGRLDYEDFILRKLHTCFSTSHVLYQEWDSAIINPAAWNSSWIEFDWIGAPWVYPEDSQPGYPPTTAENCVGGGGFSLRSRRLCEAVSQLIPEGEPPSISLSDVYICRTRRKELEDLGMKFAPFAEAWKFSCENRIYSGQFGFHGASTIKFNNWQWDFR
jgi:hypothetical protein